MSFEDVMMKRLADCHAEACNEILASVRAGRSLSDAVSDAIEALPTNKTRDLRRWIEDWEHWEEWQRFAARGWKIVKRGRKILLRAPRTATGGRKHYGEHPNMNAVAAGANVRDLALLGATMYEGSGAILEEEYIGGRSR